MIQFKKNTKPDEKFAGSEHKSSVIFNYEKSPLHTIVYGGSGNGRTYVLRQYLK